MGLPRRRQYYVAEYTKDGAEEEKQYAVYQESDSIWEFEQATFEAEFSGIELGAFASLTGKESLKELISKIDGGSLDGTTFDFKYFSSGEGNLTVEGKTVDTDY